MQTNFFQIREKITSIKINLPQGYNLRDFSLSNNLKPRRKIWGPKKAWWRKTLLWQHMSWEITSAREVKEIYRDKFHNQTMNLHKALKSSLIVEETPWISLIEERS